MEPLISIVVPTRNSERTLDECLSSLINQTSHNIEIIIVDTQSNDNTINIARKYLAKIIETEWKLLGARYLGFKASKGDYILYLDSDQILNPQTLEQSILAFSDYDMLCLEEESYKPQSSIQKLIAADRKLVNMLPDLHLDPLEGVLIPRFYKYALLDRVFKKIDVDNIHNLTINEDCILYNQAYSISSKVGIISKALIHQDSSSFCDFFRKNYLYGKNTRELLKVDNLYTKLMKRNIRFRKGLGMNLRSVQSILLRLMKIIPFLIGVCIGRINKHL
jgi:glycosyltransferase involved in cell wall biosynthesis